GRDGQILVADGRGDIVWGHAAGVHGFRVEVDHDLPLLAAPGLRHPRPLNGAELLDDEVLAIVKDLLFGQRVAADRDLDDRHAGGTVTDDIGRCDAGWHDLQQRLTGGRDLRLGLSDLSPRLKVDTDDAHAIERLALDMFDV